MAAWDEDIPDVSTLSPQERVRVGFRAFLLFTTSHPAFYGFMLHEMHSSSPRLQWFIDNFLSKIRSRILPQIISSQHDGELPTGDTNLLYYMLLGAATVLSALSGEIATRTDKSISDPKVASEYWPLLEKVFFRTEMQDRRVICTHASHPARSRDGNIAPISEMLGKVEVCDPLM
ncbi:hypothetical protein [Rhizobium sp.]|uniref:hypothetical protein n=1 Tax=Rhizobium sp. TaxID=391 RepID=UPI000E7EDE53|nr:hypothetical protein [Rhizobium sp.]